jgi:hypothetical protein
MEEEVKDRSIGEAETKAEVEERRERGMRAERVREREARIPAAALAEKTGRKEGRAGREGNEKRRKEETEARRGAQVGGNGELREVRAPTNRRRRSREPVSG